jgi:hypothetical protein
MQGGDPCHVIRGGTGIVVHVVFQMVPYEVPGVVSVSRGFPNRFFVVVVVVVVYIVVSWSCRNRVNDNVFVVVWLILHGDDDDDDDDYDYSIVFRCGGIRRL